MITTSLAIDTITDIIIRDIESDLDDRWWEFARKTAAQERRFKPKLRALFREQRDSVLERMESGKARKLESRKAGEPEDQRKLASL